MTIEYQPRGILISSSFSISSSFANSVVNTPLTASFASHSLAPAGPTGSIYRIITGSIQTL